MMSKNKSEVSGAAAEGAAPLRSLIGGALMGLANLVPGVSGGTMLLAVGVYPRFIDAIAELTRLRFQRVHIITLACVVSTGGLAILLLAGPTRDLVVQHRWIMYSLFIGLTLGGVPIVWRMARPATSGVWAGALFGLALMFATTIISPGGEGGVQSTWWMLGVAGLLGGSAMILPGISGGYMLLVLGQYVPILAGINRFRDALATDGGPDFSAAIAAGVALLPFCVGVLAGVTLISNVVEWALVRFRAATLGFLLGLLVGAVVGLWPFQRSIEPRTGIVVKGQLVTDQSIATIAADDWPLERFTPSGGQVAGSLLLIIAGIGATMLIGRLGDRKDSAL
jgi:putative membrane protein